MKPVTDKAEVAIDFPDKAYMGSFGHSAQYEARVENDGVLIKLVRPGDDRREVEVHLHWFLFAGVLEDLAAALAKHGPIDDLHRDSVRQAAAKLHTAVGG